MWQSMILEYGGQHSSSLLEWPLQIKMKKTNMRRRNDLMKKQHSLLNEVHILPMRRAKQNFCTQPGLISPTIEP